MGVAANWFATVAVIGQELGFVPDAYLPHFNARLKLTSQVLDQVAEVDPFLRRADEEIKDDTFIAQQMLDINQVHLQLKFIDETGGDVIGSNLIGFPLAFESKVFLVHHPQDVATGWVNQELLAAFVCFAEDRTSFDAPWRLNHHTLGTLVQRRFDGFIFTQETGGAMTHEVFHTVLGESVRVGAGAHGSMATVYQDCEERNKKIVGNNVGVYLALRLIELAKNRRQSG